LTIVVKNNGPNTAQNVTANCWLNPKLFTYLVDDGKGYYNHHTGIWNIGTLKSGSSIILHIQTKMMMFRTTSTYRVVKNQFTTTSTTYDSSQKNNKAVIVLAVPRITIKTLASSLAIGTKSKFDKAVNIFNWVRDYVDYSYYYGTRYGASGTLKKLKGNCVDLSHLIVALARASGLPVRYKYGTCFFFNSHVWISHVWTNIYVKGRWYAADASNNINEFGVVKSWNTSNYKLNGIYTTLPF
jgi:transglutaminase-like putative cysteine protease